MSADIQGSVRRRNGTLTQKFNLVIGHAEVGGPMQFQVYVSQLATCTVRMEVPIRRTSTIMGTTRHYLMVTTYDFEQSAPVRLAPPRLTQTCIA